MMNPSPVRAHPAANGRIHQHGFPPLQWWRGEHLPELSDEATIAVLRETLSRIAVLGLGDWRAAAQGDELAAVRVALRVASQSNPPDGPLDCVGSALLLCVLKGSLTAALVLAHLRRRHGTTVNAAERGA